MAGRNNSHLDIIHNLYLLERVWLMQEEKGDGLNEQEFTDFLSNVLKLPPRQLSTLFQKVFFLTFLLVLSLLLLLVMLLIPAAIMVFAQVVPHVHAHLS